MQRNLINLRKHKENTKKKHKTPNPQNKANYKAVDTIYFGTKRNLINSEQNQK